MQLQIPAGAPAGTTLSPDGKTLTVPGQGTWTIDPTTGAITFTPAAGFTGNPTPVSYVVSDSTGRVSAPAAISVAYAAAAGGGGSVTAVPTLETWGLSALALALGALGARRRRAP